jgi:predicted nucleic acid-binding protein
MSGKRKQPRLIGVDTNIFIYHYQNNPQFGSYTSAFFTKLVERKIKAVTSIITLIELLSFSAEDKEIEVIEDAFLSTPNLTIFALERDIGINAARIRRVYKFRLPDAIQLATALSAKADVFLTNDKRLKSFKEIPIVFLDKS